MIGVGSDQPTKLLPDPPGTPPRWDPAPAVAEDEAVWDGVRAGAEARHAVLDWADRLTGFRMATGTYVVVESTTLHGADFHSFTASGCAFLGCDLGEASFHEARMSGTRLRGCTVDDVRGVRWLRGARIGPDQLVPLGATLLAELDIRITDPETGFPP